MQDHESPALDVRLHSRPRDSNESSRTPSKSAPCTDTTSNILSQSVAISNSTYDQKNTVPEKHSQVLSQLNFGSLSRRTVCHPIGRSPELLFNTQARYSSQITGIYARDDEKRNVSSPLPANELRTPRGLADGSLSSHTPVCSVDCIMQSNPQTSSPRKLLWPRIGQDFSIPSKSEGEPRARESRLELRSMHIETPFISSHNEDPFRTTSQNSTHYVPYLVQSRWMVAPTRKVQTETAYTNTSGLPDARQGEFSGALSDPNLLRESGCPQCNAIKAEKLAQNQSVQRPDHTCQHSCNHSILEPHEASALPQSATARSRPPDVASGGISEALQRSRMYARARKLPLWLILAYRLTFGTFILLLNGLLLATYFLTHRHRYLLAILVFMRSKDLLSTIIDMLGLLFELVSNWVHPSQEVPRRWVLSVVSAYAETDKQIRKTILSLADQKLGVHRQVICIIVDGKNPDVLTHMSNITHSLKRPYITWKGTSGELRIYSGFMKQTPVLLIKKLRNAGKKDSLILAHDLFNFPRNDMPEVTRQLRQEMSEMVIPALIDDMNFNTFHGIFCTDADSTIYPDALKRLADALARKKSAIAACGVLVADLAAPVMEWTVWHMYQQFQYTFGQYVRRQAEGIWGRVTCLPGCITMIAVRPEMGPAISKYAKPVTGDNLLEHQVQHLGTDRRLTWCMLSQSARLTSLFVPTALCETVVPSNLEHYLSQRRRWASNAYFNDYYYAFSREQRLITRLFALIDIVRQSLVFYRVINTALFIRTLILHFYIMKITPTLILTKSPAAWFFFLVLVKEPLLRPRFHKLLVGMCINQVISPILSIIVFANVLLNMGSQAWGKTGVSSATTVQPALQLSMPPLSKIPIPAEQSWTPNRLANLVRTTIRGLDPQKSASKGNRTGVRVHSNTPAIADATTTPPAMPAVQLHQIPSSPSASRRRTPRSIHQ